MEITQTPLLRFVVELLIQYVVGLQQNHMEATDLNLSLIRVYLMIESVSNPFQTHYLAGALPRG